MSEGSALANPRFDSLGNLRERPIEMAKPHRQNKKANHGKRPANAKARRLKRWKTKT
jgi:hypothetical protein